MAASTTVYATTPLAGIELDAKGSTLPWGIALLTRVSSTEGVDYVLCRASEALGSVTTVLIRTAGSASSDSGSAGWTLNAPGGLTAGQYGWARRTAV